MPCQTPSWTEFLICPVCTNEFAANLRVPITLRCGHSICKKCLASIQQCPYDQSTITKELDNLPINFALLQLVTTSTDNNNVEPEILPSIVQSLTDDELQCYKLAKGCIETLALYLKPNGSIAGLFSRPMQRKLVTLINCQLIEDEGRARSMRAARSLGERTVTELILQHQNPQQLSANLWAAVRARGCQFLGPAMQEEVLKLVLLALEDGASLCRKVLVMFVVQKLESTFPQASKTSIGHVVQLLYRASCFIVSKRDGDSSLMQLKEEFRTYKSLRKEHDAQIVQIATEAGLRIAPDQWSALLYGDPEHKSDMQSLIDKQQSPQSFGQSVQELMIALQRTGDPASLSALRTYLTSLAAIDASPESNIVPSWKECAEAIEAVKLVVNGLVEFVTNHSSRKSQDAGHLSHTTRYKISFCRDLSIRGNCPRGPNCTFAHSDEELERYRSKMKKNTNRSQMKGPPSFSANSGPNPKVNISQAPYGGGQEVAPARFNKSMPYRSENSLLQTPAKSSQHLMPTYPTGASSSTPNLSQTQLSPKMLLQAPQASHMNNRFSYNGNNFGGFPKYMDQSPPPVAYHQNYHPPLSAPPVTPQQYRVQPGYSSDNKKSYSNSSYTNQMPSSHSPSAGMKYSGNVGYFQAGPPTTRNDDLSNNNNNIGLFGDSGNTSSTMWRSGSVLDKIKNKSPNSLMLKTALSTDSNNTSPTNRGELSELEMQRMMMYRNRVTADENDGARTGQMWSNSGKNVPVFQFNTLQARDNFTRSDSILTTNTDDEFSFDSLPCTSGKYGAIGINQSARPWNVDIPSTLPKRFEALGLNGSSEDAMAAPMGDVNSRVSQIPNGNNGNRSYKGIFQNVPVSPSNVNTQASTVAPRTMLAQQQKNHLWMEPMQNWSDGSPKDLDVSSEGSLGISGMSKNFWEYIGNE